MIGLAQLLQDLIALPSVNPAFVEPGNAFAGEQRVAAHLLDLARRAGLDAELQAVRDGRANLLVRLAPTGKVSRRIVLAPHLDTIVADAAQLQPRLVKGRIHGRGACDTKGSVTAMFAAVLDLAASGHRPQETEIVFAGVIDEENNQLGSRALVKSGFKADLAIVGEPTRCDVVSAHKGNIWLSFETKGRAAHGSTPHLGRNAILEMARVVELLETRYAKQLSKRKHPLLGSPSISVGVIHGGQQPNIVPDHCVMRADRRLLPGENPTAIRKELLALLKKEGLTATICDAKGVDCLATETDPDRPLVQAFLKSAGRKTAVGANYFCDAAVFGHSGTPAIVFGPGDIAQAHTADEWIAVRQLERAHAVLLKFLRHLP
jgi:acetylornithine deacetylase/succinyl-diaminopimelate desuccinylase-like protein